MKKIIKQDIDSNIVQITVADERWYMKTLKDKTVFVPSVTWIAGFYPKGIAFYKWLANKGWDEAEAIKQAAAEKGSKVHQAISDLIDGKEVKMESFYDNPKTGEREELTLEEYEAIMSFVNWYNLAKPRVIAREMVVFNDEEGYAGTIDLLCEIEGKVAGEYRMILIDLKTGQYIWPEHELQVSAYKRALIGKEVLDFDKRELVTIADMSLGILQLGYRLNKKGFKFTEIDDKFDLFLAAKRIWAEECSKIEPLKRDYPMSLTLKKEEDDADKGTE